MRIILRLACLAWIAAATATAGEPTREPSLTPALRTLVQTHLDPLPPGSDLRLLLPEAALAAGELFGAGQRRAVIVTFAAREPRAARESQALVLLAPTTGGWQATQIIDLAAQARRDGGEVRFAGSWPFRIADLGPHGAPLLLLESTAGSGGTGYDLYAPTAGARTLVRAASGFGNPRRDEDAGADLRSRWRFGGGSNLVESWAWDRSAPAAAAPDPDAGWPRLTRRWSASQAHNHWTRLIGSGAGAVELEFTDDIEPGGSWRAVGDLMSFRNLPVGDGDEAGVAPFRVQLDTGRGRRVLSVTPHAAATAARALAGNWHALASRALLTEPDAAPPGAAAVRIDGRELRLVDHADIAVRPGGPGIAYRILRGGEAGWTVPLAANQQPRLLLAAQPPDGSEPHAFLAATLAGNAPPPTAAGGTWLFCILPDLLVDPHATIPGGIVVRELTSADGQVRLGIAIEPPPPDAGRLIPLRAVVQVDLGRLPPGPLTVAATVAHAGGVQHAELAATVGPASR